MTGVRPRFVPWSARDGSSPTSWATTSTTAGPCCSSSRVACSPGGRTTVRRRTSSSRASDTARALGDRVEFHQVDHYREVVEGRDDLEVIDPTSRGLRRLVAEIGAEVLPSRGFVTSEQEFAEWMAGRTSNRLVMEDFYRWSRARTGILMDGDDPVGGRWNYDHDNRERPPKGATSLGLPEPWWPEEDDIDAEVRADLDEWERKGIVRFVGEDGPRRFAVTPKEGRLALDDFVASRLNDFGPFEDASLQGDWTMAHSLLSATMNMGVLDPADVIERITAEHAAGRAPIQSVEGIVRQIMGWRDYVWHLYWAFEDDYTSQNRLDAHRGVPTALQELDASGIEAACLSHVVDKVRTHGWAHHIERLMILGNLALQRGYDPAAMNDWFIDSFVDGTPWVMPANVVGMALHADGGRMATKPYAGGGAYIDRMSDHCGGCPFDPKVRVGPTACPYTAGYWWFLERNRERLRGNARMAQPLAGLGRLKDLPELVAQEDARRSL
nr:cryptochrome/photolyase family protein [Clavibacter michiganensis]